ncbi:hypothetical protein WMF27_24110 [Sorangium sp. So ce281]|uniref:hypothetical protein n=1 Tax=unclassified Sorangium TaxID=2621164 RepID=UPI003F5E2DEE
MQAQATCLPLTSSPEAGTDAGANEPAARPDDAPAAPAPGPAVEPTAGGGHRSWTAALLAERPSASLREALSRVGVGVGLAALYGLSLGARQGGVSFVRHAAGVPAAMIAVACVGVPALTIVLTLFDAPLDPPRALSATARAAAATGLVLGGLAPASALFVVTSGADATAALMGLLGLAVGGAVGIGILLRDLGAVLQRKGDLAGVSGTTAALVVFAVFAAVLALRVWWGMLPILKGGAL